MARYMLSHEGYPTKSLGECVGHHVISRTVDESEGSFLNDPADEVEMHIDVLCASVILMILSERDCQLIV